MTHTIDIDAIIRNAQEAVSPEVLKDHSLYAFRDADGATVLLETPGYTREAKRAEQRAAPAMIARKVVVRDVDSLHDYLRRNTAQTDPDDDGGGISAAHAHDNYGELEVWADIDARRITAVLDGGPGHRRHTAVLELKHSAEWKEWAGIDGKLFPQVQFAQFIEDHISSIGEPSGGILLDVVQTLTAKTKVDFRSSTMLANGQRQFEFAETIEAKAGAKGNLTIPSELKLVLRPFQGSDPVVVTARFRYQISEGALALGVRLAEPQRVLEEAFDQIVAEVGETLPVRVNHGVG